MCLVALLVSLIPVLSGYALYLVFAAVITEGSVAVQLTVGFGLAGALVVTLSWAARRLDRYRALVRSSEARSPDFPNREF